MSAQGLEGEPRVISDATNRKGGRPARVALLQSVLYVITMFDRKITLITKVFLRVVYRPTFRYIFELGNSIL